MKLRINTKELWPALLMLVIGVATVVGSLNYQVGSLLRMGPGYYPLLLGGLLTLIAIFILLSSVSYAPVKNGHDKTSLSFRQRSVTWSLVIVSVILFIIIGKYGGLVPATFLLCFVAALGDRGNSLKAAFFIGLSLTIFAVLVFVYGLKIPFPLFAWG